MCAAPAQNWDGSGGNDAAIRHYEATGRRYPLAVKLGTVTPHGADVYSYAPDENDMVLDPKLVWGCHPTLIRPYGSQAGGGARP